MFWRTDDTLKTVWDMYLYAKDNNIELLSSFTTTSLNDYMDMYHDNSDAIDLRFARMFKDYRYYNQDVESDNDIEDVVSDFVDDVSNFFLVNDFKLSMKFRLEEQLVNATSSTYGVLNDFDITETKEAERTSEGEYVSGAREDSSDNDYGQRIDSTQNVYGQRTDTTSNSYGERTDTSTNQIMAYNSGTFVDDSKSTVVKGAETDSVNATKGSETDTSNFTKGAQQDESTYNKGQQTDNTSNSVTEEYTINKRGSVTNPSKNVSMYEKTWNNYGTFWNYVFKEISKELLLI